MLLRRLIQSMAGETQRGIPVTTVQIEYADLCAELGIPMRPWNPVAACLAVLIRRRGGPIKTYAYRVNMRGTLKRERVFVIPTLAAV